MNAVLGIEHQPTSDKAHMRQTGFIAQEVEQTANELNFEFSGVDKPQTENEFYGLRYAEFVVPLAKAIQEQQAQIEALQKENEALKTVLQRFNELEARLTKIENGNSR